QPGQPGSSTAGSGEEGECADARNPATLSRGAAGCRGTDPRHGRGGPGPLRAVLGDLGGSGALGRCDRRGRRGGRLLDRDREAAMEAFALRDLELARRLPSMDEPIDRLNRGILAEVLRASDDEAMLEWAIEMRLVARLIERVGDHAVDIGEQVAYLVTGVFAE